MTTEAKPKVDLCLLEEDDEFEEFPAEDWTSKAEDEADVNVWEDNWDDDDVEDDFSMQLRIQRGLAKFSEPHVQRTELSDTRRDRAHRAWQQFQEEAELEKQSNTKMEG